MAKTNFVYVWAQTPLGSLECVLTTLAVIVVRSLQNNVGQCRNKLAHSLVRMCLKLRVIRHMQF